MNTLLGKTIFIFSLVFSLKAQALIYDEMPTKTHEVETVVAEGDQNHVAYFLLEIGNPLNVDVSVDYFTRDDTAISGLDYVATSGTATIYAGETSTAIGVEIISDAISEGDEQFFLVIHNPKGAGFPTGYTEISTSKTITEIEPHHKLSGAIELGPVKGASIAIQTLDGYTLYTAITNNIGYFSINIDDFHSAVINYGAKLNYVKVVSTGGIDTDPNDDGVFIESEQKAVKGSVAGIVPLNTLYEAKTYRINFLSTALLDILDEQSDVSDEQVAYIVKRLGIPDITKDGKIDIEDVINYKMSRNDSVAETNLRDGFLEYIHDGNTESRQLFIEDLKYDVGFSRPLIERRYGSYSVNLSKTDIENTIYYGIVVDQNNPDFLQYNGEELTLYNGSALYYQECSDDYGCYKLQKIFFYEDNYFVDYDYEKIDDDYSELQQVSSDLKAARLGYKRAQEKIKIIESEILELGNQIDSLKEKVNSI